MFQDIEEVDDLKQHVVCRLAFQLRWSDARLIRLPAAGNISFLLLGDYKNDIYLPDLYLYSIVGYKPIGFKKPTEDVGIRQTEPQIE